MINVICVKWGTKYTYKDVNRLLTMVERNLTIPFNFYCLTEDPLHIDPKVNIIPIKHDHLEVWWNKLAMFEEGFGDLEGKCLFFDLDVIIQNNVDDIVNYSNTGLCKIHAYWKPDSVFDNDKVGRHRYDMKNNSSCLVWNANELGTIWEHFYDNEDIMLLKYRGIDRMIYWEDKLNHYISTFPDEWFYSRCFGDGETIGQIPTDKIIKMYDDDFQLYLYDRPERKVCLLNGNKYFTEQELLQGLEKYYV